MRHFLVVNPKSANGQTGRRWPEIAAAVSQAVGEFGHAFTTVPFEAAALTRAALKQGFDCVVAVGGDGTMNEVINGFFEDDRVVREGAAFGLISRGTGGDFRRTFGWDKGLDQAVARLRGALTRPLDVGRVRFRTPAGGAASRYFVNVASFGASGVIDQEVNRSSKALGGKLSFMLAATKGLLRYRDQRVRIRADEGAWEELTVTTLAVGNGQYFGGGMKVCPNADPSDGWFDVTVWTGYGLADFALRGRALYDGSHLKFEGTRTFRCKRLEAQSDEQVLLDLDGEQPGSLPCQMDILPAAVRLKT